jgi:hypothetical protein
MVLAKVSVFNASAMVAPIREGTILAVKESLASQRKMLVSKH